MTMDNLAMCREMSTESLALMALAIREATAIELLVLLVLTMQGIGAADYSNADVETGGAGDAGGSDITTRAPS